MIESQFVIMSETRRGVNPVRRGVNPVPPRAGAPGTARSSSAPIRQPGPAGVRRPTIPAPPSRISKFVRPPAFNRAAEESAASAIFGRLDLGDDENSAKVPDQILKQVLLQKIR